MDEKLCVLQIASLGGWFALCLDHILPACYKCEQKHELPVIDMYTHKERLKFQCDVNIWECFYEQPAGVSLSDAIKSNDIKKRDILANRKLNPWTPQGVVSNVRQRECFCSLWNKYIVLRKEVQKIIDDEYDNIIGANKDNNVLGCSLRGTDYLSLQPLGHSRLPTIDEYISGIHKYRKRWNCAKIYISTEDDRIYKRIKDEFGDLVVFYEEPRININAPIDYNRDHGSILNYIVSKGILAKCDYLLGVITGGTLASIGMNDLKYRDMYIFQKGVYGDDVGLMEHIIRGTKNRMKMISKKWLYQK